MPFNIELLSNDISIKIQVLKKSIVVYFNGEEDHAIAAREHWMYLVSQFIKGVPGFGSEHGVALDAGIFHRKKEHSTIREATIFHCHNYFSVEIKPELFAHYLNQFYIRQLENTGQQFFADSNEVENIIKLFTEYYKGYKGSTLEAEYDADTELNEKEQAEHEEELSKAKARLCRDAENDFIRNILLSKYSWFRLTPNEKEAMENSSSNEASDTDDYRIM